MEWNLYETFCSGQMKPKDSDNESPDAYIINLFSSCLWAIYDIVCNQGAELFSENKHC